MLAAGRAHPAWGRGMVPQPAGLRLPLLWAGSQVLALARTAAPSAVSVLQQDFKSGLGIIWPMNILRI